MLFNFDIKIAIAEYFVFDCSRNVRFRSRKFMTSCVRLNVIMTKTRRGIGWRRSCWRGCRYRY